MTTDPYIGRLLANRYQLVDLVGKGAMGRVYQAKDMLLGGVTVAVKFLSQALMNQKMRDRFSREATICAILGEKSIHIVRVRDYGVDENDVPYYVMEYLEGDNLSEVIKPRPLQLPRFISFARQISLGLQLAHKGIIIDGELCPIIHRDIKPSNILVVEDPTLGELVKVLDFGIAKLLQADSNQTHSFMGTLAYCSPEQMEGKELDKRSDIYSLGVMMYEMLTGEMPLIAETHSFGGWYKAHHFVQPRSFHSINPRLKLPKALEDLVMGCMAKKPGDRPQSAVDVLQILESLEQQPRRERSPEPPPKSPPRSGIAVVPTPKITLSADEICRRTTWPSDKPVAKIVFPHLLRTPNETLATLWVMLNQRDIKDRQISTRYNQFLFCQAPHPMVLWITALHNRECGARWLPCYLDLKTSLGQQITRLLGESGQYRILFFALEDPQRCTNVMTSTIAPAQRHLLIEWANKSQKLASTAQSPFSKKLLKEEFEKLKPKIILKLEAIHTDYPSDISG